MNNDMKKRITDSVDQLKNELVEALSKAVRIPSVTSEYDMENTKGMETEASVYMEQIMKEMGLETELIEAVQGRKNAVGVYKAKEDGKSLLFNGHIDVVPPGDLNAWEKNPFSGEVDETYVYGRGTADMKGGNLAALYALKAILQAGYAPAGDIIFSHSVGEECKATEAGTGAIMEKGYRADAAIVCEPTCGAAQFEVNPAQSGVFEMKWMVKGKACHAGMRREVIRDGGAGAVVGVDAIEKGMILYNAIKNLERKWGQSKKHPLYKPGNFCINGAVIQAGAAPSIVPEKMEMSYAIFYPPQDTAESIKEELEACIQNACQTDEWLKENPPEITWIFNWPSFDCSVDEEIVKTAVSCVKEIVPDGGAVSGMFAVCDGCFIYEKRIPVIVLGPGNVSDTHTANEKVAISELVEAAKIYAMIIAEWCGLTEVR